MIEITGIEKSFGSQQVLKGINLTIRDGELMAIIGRSGGGKSVLLKTIIGLVKPDAGSVMIGDVDIVAMKGKERDAVREKLGVLFQGGALFDSMTAFENVAFPLQEKTKLSTSDIHVRVMTALEEVGLTNVENKYPSEMSGGMKKRVALARTLVTGPSVVFFDEPTTGLDPILLNATHKLIRQTHKTYGFTGIVISHEIPEIFDIVDRIAFLHEGAIRAVGTPEEILSTNDTVVWSFLSGQSDDEDAALSDQDMRLRMLMHQRRHV